MLESAAFVGLAIPGETVMLLGGFLAYQGKASLPLMMAVAAVGAVVGDSIGYEIGRRFGPSLKASRLGQRVGDERWARAESYLARQGGRAVFLGRFVGVLRALVPAIAGLTNMPYKRFLAWNAAGGLVWGPVIVGLGFVSGSSYRRVEKYAGRASLVLLLLATVVIVVVFVARSASRNRADIVDRLQRVGRMPMIDRLRTRFDAQLHFVAERLRPGGAYGLSLSAGLVFLAVLGWLFGAVLVAIVGHPELARVDVWAKNFFDARQDSDVRTLLRVIAAAGDWRVLVAATAVIAFRFGRAQLRASGLVGLCVIGAAGLAAAVSLLVDRVGPAGQAHSFPSFAVTSITAMGIGVGMARDWTWRGLVAIAAAAGTAVLLVAMSVVALDRAWVFDAIGGFALGGLWAAVVLVPARTLRLASPGVS
jgi:undecaprenyl-diphosphatase